MSDHEAKAPAAQWYPGDWMRDLELQSCSLAARGLWKELLCRMHFATPRGYLRTAAGPIPDTQIPRMVNAAPGEDVMALLAELERAGVFSRDEEGAIYNRRMARQAEISAKRSEAGKKGAEVALAKQAAKVEQNSADVDVGAEVDVEKEFDSLWSACAKKVAKGAAKRVYLRLRKSGSIPSLADVTAKLVALQGSDAWTKDGREYQPHLATWLNREGWLDEIPKRSDKLAWITAGGARESVAATPDEFDPIESATWKRVRESLRKKLTAAEFAEWIVPLSPMRENGDGLTLAAPNSRFVYTVEEKYRGLLDREAAAAGDELFQIQLVASVPRRKSA